MELSPIGKDHVDAADCTARHETSHRRSKRSRNVEMEIDNLYKAVPQLRKVFNVVDKIGEGTFSAVYLGEAKMLDGRTERFALKRLIPTSHPARIAAELECLTIAGGRENVMGATYCFRKEGEVVIVMPYMEHQPIGEIIGLLSFEEVRLYIYNLLKALKHIHEFGIIHRDIKFNNFLYNREAKMYSLVDFGLAQGTADTQIELLKVVKQRASQKAGGATGKTDTGALGKKAPRAPDTPTPVTTTASTHQPQPAQQSPAPPSSSSPSTTVTPTTTTTTATSPPSAGKAVARTPTPTTTTTTTTTTKHTKDLARRLNKTPRPVFGERNFNSVPSALSTTKPAATKIELVKPDLINRRMAPIHRRVAPASRRMLPARSQASAQKPPRTATVNPAFTCNCYQTERVCNICMSRKKQVAPRAGTPGFRAPEVLTCCPNQGTAIDVWSAGVILLSLLSGRYPFFKGGEDLVGLTQIMIVRGSRETIQAAKTFGKAVLCSKELLRQDLRVLCEMLRGRRPAPDQDDEDATQRPKEVEKNQVVEVPPKHSSVTASLSRQHGQHPEESPVPPMNDHHLPIKKQHRHSGSTDGAGCRPPAQKASRLQAVEGVQVREEEEEDERGWDTVPDEVYGLLDRLLDLNPATRITAAEALLHPLFKDLN